MRMLIVGGTRFIGRHLLEKALQRGDQVSVFHRGSTPLPEQFAGVKEIIGDRKQIDQLRQAVAHDYDAIIDTVIYSPDEAAQAVDLFSGRTGHYVMISTGNVYKLDRLPGPYRESDPLEDDPQFSYGYNKRCAEDVLFTAYRERQFPAVSLRMPSIYGPWDYQAREWYFIKRLLDGRTRFLLPDAGLGVFHREYAGNIADQLLCLIATPQSRGEAYNAGHLHFQTCAGLVRMAAKCLGREVELFTLPRAEMPWSIALSPGLIYYQTTEKLATIGYAEQVDLIAGWERTFEFYQANPIVDWLFQQRSEVDLFDYVREDELIRSKGVLIS